MKQDDLQAVKLKAVEFLSRREHSEHELRTKLGNKGFADELVEQVITLMLEADYLNESRYTRMLIRSGFDKGHGPQKIRHKLKQQCVAESLVQDMFAEFEGDWFELARSVRERKFSHLEESQDREERYKARSKQMRFLAGRGFGMDQINYALEASFHED